MAKKKTRSRKRKPERKKVTYYLDERTRCAVDSLIQRYSAASASEALRRALPDYDRCFDFLREQGQLPHL